MLLRSILRTIRSTLVRYLAILAIIALGVGFFVGLRVTEESIIKTADRYLSSVSMTTASSPRSGSRTTT